MPGRVSFQPSLAMTRAISPEDPAFWRDEFPPRGDVVYLNHASESPLPVRSRQALEAALEGNAHPDRLTRDTFFGLPDRCRELAAAVVGGEADEIALTNGTTWGLNVAAQGLPLDPGDEILVFDGEFPANVYPWWNAAGARGLALRVAPAPETPRGRGAGFPLPEDVEAALSRRTRVLALSLVSFTSGFRAPVEEIASLCRTRGIFLVLDAVQGVGAVPFHARDSGADAVAVSGHKWLLSPTGTGFLWVRRELLDGLRPSFVGWLPFLPAHRFEGMTRYRLEMPSGARRYETGSAPYFLLAAMEQSLRLLLDAGTVAIGRRLRRLNAVFAAEAERRGWRAAGPWGEDEPGASGIVSVMREGTGAEEGARALRRAGFYGVVREGWLRVSPHLHVTEEEMERAARALPLR